MFFDTNFAANVSQEGSRTRPAAGAERQEAMSSSMINPVGRVGMELIGSLNRPELKQRPAVQQQAKAAYASSAPVNSGTQLQFRVDEKTNDVTIMIMDKATDKVIRTIPPEAIKDIPIGQLMEYST
ncbi:MAG: flagellar protein FlaG [Leptolinea sp.]